MPGILGLPGGTIEAEDEASDDVILSTLRREIREEVNVEVTDCQLVISRYFEADGDPVVNLVFLCRYLSGEAAAIDPDEVEEIYWMTVEDAIKQENCREWTQLYLERADSLRKKIQQTG